jgi:hypothetical protein
VPDVPEDIDFLMEHLNDPNYDLRRSSFVSSTGSSELDHERATKYQKRTSAEYNGLELDSESQADTTRCSITDCAALGTSGIDLDERVLSLLSP